jgi:UPF0716 protein FxsA
MLFKLFALFVITPLVELAILIKLGEMLGFTTTFSLVIITGAFGAWLANNQGLKVIGEFNKSMARAQMPTDPLIEGLLVVVGGAFLLTPGLITDVLGFSLVIPYSRKWLKGIIKARIQSKINISVSGAGPAGFYYTSSGHDFRKTENPNHDKDDNDVIDI